MKHKIIYTLAISCLFLLSSCGSAQSENQSISLEEAKSAALDDAQLGIDEVEFLKTERNTDGNTSYYDIQFIFLRESYTPYMGSKSSSNTIISWINYDFDTEDDTDTE